MHEMTRAVRELIPELERQQFSEPEDREKLMEIRELAIEQVDDDADKIKRGQVGRSKVEAFPWALDSNDLLFPARTRDQFALEEGLQPLLESALTGEQRVVTRWRYSAMYTERQIAALLGISQQAVHARIETIHRRLRDVLMSAFGPKTEEEEA